MQIQIRTLIFLGAVMATGSIRAADKPAAFPAGIKVGPYTGWSNSISLYADEVQVRAVVVPAIGGRVAHYSLSGDNIIFENPESFGKTLAVQPEGLWVGGYQCDLGPELRPVPNHPKLWMGQYQWQATKDFSATVTSEPDLALGVQMEKEFLLAPETGELGIVQRMKNISQQDVSFCLWDRTLCQGGGFVFFPLNKKSRFKARWSLHRTVDGKPMYDGDKPSSPRVQVFDDVLVVEARGEASKLGADSDAGWIAYARGRLLFVKFYPYFADGRYTDGGNSVETYWDQKVAELEPLSPERTLKPGESYTFPEKWMLIQLKKDVTTHKQARALVSKIPPSPFRR